jgi:hypothetical protein
VFQKPLKIVSGVVRQLQPGDFIDPQYTPAVIVDAKLVTLSVNGLTPMVPESMVMVTPAVGYVNKPPATSISPGVGKMWILSGMSAAHETTDGNPRGCMFRLRCNPTGSTVVTSSQIGLIAAGAQVGKSGVFSGNSVNLSTDQWAVTTSGTQSIGVTCEGSGGLASFLLWGFEVSTA